MLACFGNIVVKGILRITRGIGRSYAQKILPGRGRIHGKLWQDQILLPKERSRKQIILCKLNSIVNVFNLEVIRGVPVQQKEAVYHLRLANIKWHGFAVALPIVIIIFINFRPDTFQDLFVFVMCDGNVHSVRHLPDIFFRYASVMLHHGLNAFLIHVSIKLLHGGIQHIAVTLRL